MSSNKPDTFHNILRRHDGRPRSTKQENKPANKDDSRPTTSATGGTTTRRNQEKSTKYEEHIAICDIREEDEKANRIRMGKPAGKLTGWAKKWTAQFKNKHKSDSTTSTKTKQKQQKEYEKEKDTTGNDEIRTEGVGDDTEEVEETDTQRKNQANRVLWGKQPNNHHDWNGI